MQMQKGDFITVTGGNGVLGQAVIQLATIGGAGGIYATAQKENACVVTELYSLREPYVGKQVSSTVSTVLKCT